MRSSIAVSWPRRWVVAAVRRMVLVATCVVIAGCATAFSQESDTAPERSFYVDPEFGGASHDGSAEKPWAVIDAPEPWVAINQALAAASVTIYFSARKAGEDKPPALHRVICRREDKSQHRLTLDGMSQWNSGGQTPVWKPYAGQCYFRIDGKYSMALGWTNAPCVQDYITIRGFEVTGEAARSYFGGSHLIIERLHLHDLTKIGPALHIGFGDEAWKMIRAGTLKYQPLTDIVIRDCRIENTYGEAIYVGSAQLQPWDEIKTFNQEQLSHVTIERVKIINPGANGAQGDGIDTKESMSDFTVRDCEFAKIGGDVAEGTRGIIIPGTYYGDRDQNILIERCYFHDSPAKGRSVPIDGDASGKRNEWGIRGVTIRNCVFDNHKDGGINFAITPPSQSHPNAPGYIFCGPERNVGNIYIYNNTIAHVAEMPLGILANMGKIMVKNNLIFANNRNGVQAKMKLQAGVSLDCDYNAFQGTWVAPADGAHSIKLSAEQTVGLKLEFTGAQFNLSPAAIVAGKGSAIADFSNADDFNRVRRPQGQEQAWDIGAVQHSSEAAPPLSEPEKQQASSK